MPFVYSVQTGGLSFPVHMWYDAGGKRLRTEVYGGLDTTLTVEVWCRVVAVSCGTATAVAILAAVAKQCHSSYTSQQTDPLQTVVACGHHQHKPRIPSKPQINMPLAQRTPNHAHPYPSPHRTPPTCCTPASTRLCARCTTTKWAPHWLLACWQTR